MSTIDQLFNFPCEFAIKIMGVNTQELITAVIAIVTPHSAEFIAERDLQSKVSRQGNYLALTVTIIAHSRAQLDSIYLALNKHPLVKITL